jgi:hypothetical protein
VGPHHSENPRHEAWVFAFWKKAELARAFGQKVKTGFASAKAGFLFAGAGLLWSIHAVNEPRQEALRLMKKGGSENLS